MNTTFRI